MIRSLRILFLIAFCFDLTGSLAFAADVPGGDVHAPDAHHTDLLPTGPLRISIHRFASCKDGIDDTAAVTHAFEAAKNGAFTLVIDCPIRLHIGSDIEKPIFIDDGTTIEFEGPGKFIVDNVLLPAFVMADAKDITLTNWDIEYDGGLPVNPLTAGFQDNGKDVPSATISAASDAFNDVRLTPWLAQNREVVFNTKDGDIKANSGGPINAAAIFFLTGETARVNVDGMKVYVPESTGPDRYIPMVFSFSQNFKSEVTADAKDEVTSEKTSLPHDLTFTNIDLDGILMGFEGNLRGATFNHIHAHRYADLEDMKGENVGGVSKWFPAPHLFDLNFRAMGDPSLFNRNIRIMDVLDNGPRLGTARDKGGKDTISGNAASLKLSCIDCLVDNYRTSRPDGFLDLWPSIGVTISNIVTTYDSGFLNNLYPGLRFSSGPYRNVVFKNIVMADLAKSTMRPPLGESLVAANGFITFSNVTIQMTHWAGPSLVPIIGGEGNKILIDYLIMDRSSKVADAQNGIGMLTLAATPATLKPDDTATVSWATKNAQSCVARGNWNGTLANSGSYKLHWREAGNYDITMACRAGGEWLARTLRITVKAP